MFFFGKRQRHKRLKRTLQRNDHSVPVYFYIVARRPQTMHTKLRLHISDLNQDLVIRHVSNDASCKCGDASETVEHYLLHCPLYTQVRDYTIQTLAPHYIIIPVLLSGDPSLPLATNSAIFLTVHEFTVRTNRFGVVNRVATQR